MRARYGSGWPKLNPPGLARHLNRIESFIVGFENTVICEDCNNAEAAAKKIVHAHRYFSFAPFEVREFVEPVDCVVHKIDIVTLAKTYALVEQDFLLRLRVATELLEL